jgi:hypothetical protein
MVSVECQTGTFNDALEEISENVNFHIISDTNRKKQPAESSVSGLGILEQQRRQAVRKSKTERTVEDDYSYEEKASYSYQSSTPS